MKNIDKNMTYAEVKGKSSFDWGKALALDFSEMSFRQMDEMVVLSKSWVTCACGNQCSVIPRDNCGSPLDSVLEELGSEFHNIIRAMRLAYSRINGNVHRRNAIDVLRTIEERSAILIADETSRKV
jgi:hypothetical protein